MLGVIDLNQLTCYVNQNQSCSIGELAYFIRSPSISSQPNRSKSVKKGADWLAIYLKKIGLPKVEVLPTVNHQAVYAAGKYDPRRPAVLIYGHYDVQPVDPLHE